MKSEAMGPQKSFVYVSKFISRIGSQMVMATIKVMIRSQFLSCVDCV